MILVSIIVTCFIIYKECLLSFHTQCFHSKLAFQTGFRHQSETGGKKGNSLHNLGNLWKPKGIFFLNLARAFREFF